MESNSCNFCKLIIMLVGMYLNRSSSWLLDRRKNQPMLQKFHYKILGLVLSKTVVHKWCLQTLKDTSESTSMKNTFITYHHQWRKRARLVKLWIEMRRLFPSPITLLQSFKGLLPQPVTYTTAAKWSKWTRLSRTCAVYSRTITITLGLNLLSIKLLVHN